MVSFPELYVQSRRAIGFNHALGDRSMKFGKNDHHILVVHNVKSMGRPKIKSIMAAKFKIANKLYQIDLCLQ